MRSLTVAVLACIVGALMSCSARPQSAPQSPGVVVTYDQTRLRAPLRGLLYKPDGAGPFPTVLYSHGSAPGSLNTQAFDVLGPAFVTRGWAMFAPYRRGQGLSEAAGPYIRDAIGRARLSSGAGGAEREMTRLLTEDHLDDQNAALEWLSTQPFVDSSRIALAGNSFGGVLTVLGAERTEFCAAVDLAGGAESWNESPNLRAAMLAAVRRSRTPVLFIQAENDYDLGPSRALHAAALASGRPADIRIYPPFGASARDGHAFAYRSVASWHGDAMTHLERNCRG